MFGPPVVWLAAFELKYALAAAPATSVRQYAASGAGIAALALIAALGLLSWREFRVAAASPLDQYAAIIHRIRFMALLGIMSGALFFLATAAQVLAPFFIAPGKT
jgi:hypothetical protein